MSGVLDSKKLTEVDFEVHAVAIYNYDGELMEDRTRFLPKGQARAFAHSFNNLGTGEVARVIKIVASAGFPSNLYGDG